MQPRTPNHQDMPTRPLPIAQVATGMAVADATGEELGKVTGVQMPGTGSRPDVTEEDARGLMADGYFRIESRGPLGHDYYATGTQIADVTTTDDAGIVTLTVAKSELHRTA
jgi:hypothetical protein